MALQIFHHHIPKGYVFDGSKSGAEWWVQIRPSPPKTGRYSLLKNMDDSATAKNNNLKKSSNQNDVCDEDATNGISFHWDKDEELRLMTGGSMYIHPHISTVTYLTDLGAPTVVLKCKVASSTGTACMGDGLPDPSKHVNTGFISWPKKGKHLSFDGQMLHAAPSDLMPDGEFERQCRIFTSTESNTEELEKKDRRRKRRVTLLVNIWLNYRPFGVNPFPHTMIDKLSGVTTIDQLFINDSRNSLNSERIHHEQCNAKPSVQVVNITQNNTNANPSVFIWPLGGNDSKDCIKVKIPLSQTHDEMREGGNICILWMDENDPKEERGVSFIEHNQDIIKKSNSITKYRTDESAESKRQRISS